MEVDGRPHPVSGSVAVCHMLWGRVNIYHFSNNYRIQIAFDLNRVTDFWVSPIKKIKQYFKHFFSQEKKYRILTSGFYFCRRKLRSNLRVADHFCYISLFPNQTKHTGFVLTNILDIFVISLFFQIGWWCNGWYCLFWFYASFFVKYM